MWSGLGLAVPLHSGESSAGMPEPWDRLSAVSGAPWQPEAQRRAGTWLSCGAKVEMAVPLATQAHGQTGVCTVSVFSSRKTVCAGPPGRGPPAGELAAGPASLHRKAALLTPAGCLGRRSGQAPGAAAWVSGSRAPGLSANGPGISAGGWTLLLGWAPRTPQRQLGEEARGGGSGSLTACPPSGPPRGPGAPPCLAAYPHSAQGEGVLRGAVRGRTWKTPEKATRGLLPPPPCTPWACDTGVPWGCAGNTDTQAPQTSEGDAAISGRPRGTLASSGGLSPSSPRTQLTSPRTACLSSAIQPLLSVRGQEPGFGRPFISAAKCAPRTTGTGGCPSPF